MTSFGRSIGGGQGSGPIDATSQGLSLGPGTAIRGHDVRGGYSPQGQGVPDPNTGSTNPGGTAARFPALQGRGGRE